MPKQIIAFLFLLAFALQTFSRAIIVFDYAVNTKTYAKNCENKARPKMHCNGKCQMMKKLKQEEKKDQQNPERKAESKNELVYVTQSFSQTIHSFYLEDKQTYAPLLCAKERHISYSVFHPPGITA